jgi:4'-phosphopantetheinyl transferase
MIAHGHAAVMLADPAQLAGLGGHHDDSLDAADWDRIRRIRAPGQREVVHGSRLLQRHAIAAAFGAAGVSPSALRFVADTDGKPRVAAPPAACAIAFSASNTRGLVGCAVVRAAEVGFDVEAVPAAVDDDLLRECLAPSERAELIALPEARRPAAFTLLWACKEAYLKAIAVGLGTAPAAVATVAAREGRRLRDPHAASRWTLHRIAVGERHAAVACVPHGFTVEATWFAPPGPDALRAAPDAAVPHAASGVGP